MALGTPVTLGQTASATDANSYSHSTSASASSGSLVVLCAMWASASSAQTITVSGGSLTWTADKAQTGVKGSNNFGCSIWSAPAPSGLASSTSLTASMNPTATTTNAMCLAALYIPGGGSVETTAGVFNSTTMGSPWTQASLTSDEDMVMILAYGSDAAGTLTTAATGSSVELHDFEATNNIGLHVFYRGPTGGAGTFSQTGTSSGGFDSDTIAQVGYNGTVTAPPGPPETFVAIPFMR